MRYTPFLAALLLAACSGGTSEVAKSPVAQTPTATGQSALGHLLRQLAPAAGAGSVVDWTTVDPSAVPGVTWATEKAQADKEGYSLVGTVELPPAPGGAQEEPAMEWEVRLAGTEKGYDRVILAHFNRQDATTTDATTLLGQSDHTLRDVQRCEKEVTMGFTKHELTFPGKIPGWMRVEWSSGSEGLARWIEYGFDPRKGKQQEECPTE